MHGYAGKILTLDLSSGDKKTISLDERMISGFLGGRGFVSSWLYENLPGHIDPLCPDNLLVFSSGPCNGTLVPSATRGSIGAKSPLTSIMGSGNTGSSFSVQLKRAGWDMVVLSGKARRPSYLFIDAEGATVFDCEDLWGKETPDATFTLRSRYGCRNVSIACIGPAGERQVPIATVIFDRFRAAGRGGIGAVMGSKNLKALVVKGSGAIRAAHPKRLKQEVLRFLQSLSGESYYKRYSEEGTGVIVAPMHDMGCVLVKNGLSGDFEGIRSLNAEQLKKDWFIRQKACFSCPMPCTQQYGIREGAYRGAYGEGSAAASVIMGFGPRCGISDIKATAKAYTLTNELGLDLISTNAVLAFGMECFEKGLISTRDTGGIPLEFGHVPALLDMINQIAMKKGFGAVLGQGVKKAAAWLGSGSERFAPHVKGMDMMEVDPRGFSSWGLMFAVSSRGADHVRAYDVSQIMPFSNEELVAIAGTPEVKDMFSPQGKGRSVAFFENIRAVADSMEVCRFVTRGKLGFPENLVGMLCAVTGLDFTADQLYTLGERIVNVERLFNLKAGMTRAQDTLPERYLKEPLPDGAARGKTVPLAKMVEDYYKARDWSLSSGFPSREKLENLGLSLVGF